MSFVIILQVHQMRNCEGVGSQSERSVSRVGSRGKQRNRINNNNKDTLRDGYCHVWASGMYGRYFGIRDLTYPYTYVSVNIGCEHFMSPLTRILTLNRSTSYVITYNYLIFINLSISHLSTHIIKTKACRQQFIDRQAG